MKNIYLLISLFFTLICVAQGNYTVTSLSDDGSLGTLRYGIQNTTASTIDFDSGLTGTVTLTSNLPGITRNISIIGNGVNNLTMSGANSYNMFQVSGGAVLTISGITFTNNASSNGSIFRADNSNSSVIATSINVTGNSRSYAFYTNNSSIITISNSTFTSNSGTLFGSDYGSTPSNTSDTETDYSNRITVTGSTFSSNTGTIFSTERYVKIDNCIFSNNTSQIGSFRGVNRYQVLNSTFTNNTGWTLFSFSSWIGQNPSWGESTLGTNNTLFEGNTFTGNTGTIINPGGSYKYDNKTTIKNNVFTNNGTNWTGNPAVVSGNTLDNFITSVSHSSANSTITVVMNRPVFNTNSGSGALEVNDFQFSLSGGNATLGSSTPTSISASANTYILGINTIGTIYGTETITVNPALNSIYDASSNIAGSTQKNNTASLKFLDDDLDGVANYQDLCPNTQSGVVVEPANGCDDVTAPSIPTGFNVTIGTYKLTLNWNQNTDDTTGYLIYGGTDQNALSLITTISSKTTTSYSHNNLVANTTYYYKIIAKDLAGNQSLSSAIVSGSPQTPLIWDGPKITFEKTSGSDWTLEANQDFLTESVILTRKNTQGLFNIAKESGYNYLSPSDTEWAMGTTADFSNLYFSNWREAMQWCPPCQVNQDFVIHLITDDIYIDVKILSWVDSSGGGFSYERSSPNPYSPAILGDFNALSKTLYDGSFTITPPSSDSTGAFTYISSDTNVATISGSTVTIVGPGVTTITATQVADATHLTNSISADLTVNTVAVVTKNGEKTNSNSSYVNKNGALGTVSGVNANGESKVTKSN
ncbi:hypothetical protein B6A10_09840 [Flavobacterium sp. L1I52]|uniref:Fibronectin type-III domain-containing protein n=1 Tax=Flavobacterium pokkalii TaxID=1940408 RepID=A0ABR7UU50_9FLAO|nr:hypothetical protein [Flavobacterium pokkalii]MBD0725479.1 hypothetical protein [Flavobacterium pokkalii]